MRISISLVFVFFLVELNENSKNMDSQERLPFYQIPNYPDTYDSGNVVGRIVDGLGYRYYWATEGLADNDLDYRPSPEARSTRETLDHLYGLSLTIVNAPQSKANIRPADWSHLDFEEKRQKTLENLKKASELYKSDQEGDMEAYQVIFQRPDRTSEFPFWNILNGPLSDAIYHVGQIVSFRRSSGNPINPGVRLLVGKTQER